MTDVIWNYACYLSFALIITAITICFIRIVVGPHMPDRVLALDLTANLLISFIAVYSVYSGQEVYIDVILALALIVFLTTVAFANLLLTESYKKQLKARQGLNK
tara:strand:+ start:472 stop:783 length:312 start_codon:yes stop_codon:yes gene_type:complete